MTTSGLASDSPDTQLASNSPEKCSGHLRFPLSTIDHFTYTAANNQIIDVDRRPLVGFTVLYRRRTKPCPPQSWYDGP